MNMNFLFSTINLNVFVVFFFFLLETLLVFLFNFYYMKLNEPYAIQQSIQGGGEILIYFIHIVFVCSCLFVFS